MYGLYELGNLYYNGDAVEKDFTKAIELYEQSGELGFFQAQVNVAYMYETGTGTEADISKALFWYKKAADLGDKYSIGKVKELEK